jgi:hypothetical protein
MFEYTQWWEQEVVERPYALHKARCIADLRENSNSARSDDSKSALSDDSKAGLFEDSKSGAPRRLPPYLQNRGETLLLPKVEVKMRIDEAAMEGHGEGRGGKVCEEERGRTLEFVVYDLAWDLYQELLQAIRA